MSQRREYMSAAWNIARELTSLTNEEREKIFGFSDIGIIIRNNSCDKTWFKISEYKKKLQEEQISEGDVVKCQYLYMGIVTYVDYNDDGKEIFSVILENGMNKTFSRDELIRTGRSVDVSVVLKDMIYGIDV